MVSVWNRDGGTSSEQGYKCIPFYISSRGYGIFIDHRGEVELEIGVEKASRVGISVPGSSLQYYLIHGPSPLAILERYTLLTGRPALPPTWTFGLWLSTSFLTDYDEKTVTGFLKGMKDRDCDVRVFHFDCFWMKKYEWSVSHSLSLAPVIKAKSDWCDAVCRCSFTFDPENFPDPAKYLSSIKKQYGVQVCVWSKQHIHQLTLAFAFTHTNLDACSQLIRERTVTDLRRGREGRLLPEADQRRSLGESALSSSFAYRFCLPAKQSRVSYQAWDLWQPGLAIVDFTNPAACAWYTAKLEALLDLGVDSFKTDFGERIPHVDVVWHDGSDPGKMHNAYAFLYNQLVFGILERRFGKDQACVFARSAAAGGQRFPVVSFCHRTECFESGG